MAFTFKGTNSNMSACVRACVRVCARACLRFFVRRAYVRACVDFLPLCLVLPLLNRSRPRPTVWKRHDDYDFIHGNTKALVILIII